MQEDYLKEHEETKSKNRFDVTSTSLYNHQQDVDKYLSDVRV